MQTFLSEPTFEASAAVLDNKRLNKQLLEGRQILTALAGESQGWRNHPATKMWRGYEPALVSYLRAVQLVCEQRGIENYKNMSAILDIASRNNWCVFDSINGWPSWWTNPHQQTMVVMSHRANLYAKDNKHYRQYAYAWGRHTEWVVDRPLHVVCCATRRQGKPCAYYWPTHVED